MSILFRKHHLAGRNGKLGISVSTLDRMVKNGQFPRPVALSSRTVGWPSDVVERWQASRPVKGATSGEGVA